MSASGSPPLLQPSSPTKSKSMPPPSSPSRPSTTIRSTPSSPAIPSQEAHTSKKRSISEEVEDDEQQQGNPQLVVSDGDSKPQPDANDTTAEGKVNGNPNKKRKLTQAEKEEREKEKVRKEQEKLEKEREKAEKKVAIEEKKKALEEAKKKKDEEKRKKDEEKAEAQKKKDEEKRKKDEEKAKKERAQTRLSAFFAKPKGEPGTQSSKLQQPAIAPEKSTIAGDGSTVDTSIKVDSKQPSEYERYFQPFFIKQHVTVAPQHAFPRDTEYKEFIKKNLDETLGHSKSSLSNSGHTDEGGIVAPTHGINGAEMADLLHIPHHKRVPRGKAPTYTVKQLLELVNNSEAEINLSSSENNPKRPPSYYLALLNSLPRKHLRFWDDVRPPYSGTFTRLPPANSGLRKGRKPFEKSLPGVDYDYDSGDEWIAPEEEEEGEELLSELGDEDEEEDIEDEEEMDGFLDDEDDAVKRRAGALCPLLPYSTGLCWEDRNGRNGRKELSEMKMGILLEGVTGPIDPFSNRYWLPPPKAPNNTTSASSSVGNPMMSTFLSSTSNTVTTSLPHRPAQNNTVNIITTSQSSKKLIPAEDMVAFKKAVDGSDMTKAGLVELLKKQFPKASKDAIRETLGKVAVRIGGKEADKRWVLRD